MYQADTRRLLPGNCPNDRGVNVIAPVHPSVLLRGSILLAALASLAWLLLGGTIG